MNGSLPPGSKRKPVFPSSIREGMPPRLQPTTGTPLAIDSSTTNPSVSESDGITKTSAAAKARESSSPVHSSKCEETLLTPRGSARAPRLFTAAGVKRRCSHREAARELLALQQPGEHSGRAWYHTIPSLESSVGSVPVAVGGRSRRQSTRATPPCPAPCPQTRAARPAASTARRAGRAAASRRRGGRRRSGAAPGTNE